MNERKKNKSTDELLFFISIPTGIAVGVFLINLVQSFSPYQPPEGVDYTSGSKMNAWVGSLPDKAHSHMLLAFILGSFVAGFVTNYLAKNSKYRPAIITGYCLLLYSVVLWQAFPNPMWMSALTCVGIVLFSYLGGLLVRRNKKVIL
jgi:uncharacterized membrane protein YwzB